MVGCSYRSAPAVAAPRHRRNQAGPEPGVARPGGQLLKYYARALRIGHQGLDALRQRLRGAHTGSTKPLYRRTVRQLFDQAAEIGAVNRLGRGQKLRPGDVRLLVAVDQATDALRKRLLPICQVPRSHHKRTIEVWQLRGRPTRAVRLFPPSGVR